MSLSCKLLGHDFIVSGGVARGAGADDEHPGSVTWECTRCDERRTEVGLTLEDMGIPPFHPGIDYHERFVGGEE